jgi:16S rRNA processing protein RimM
MCFEDWSESHTGDNGLMDGLLATGRVRTAFGLKGFLKVQAFSDDFSHFKSLHEVVLKKGDELKKAVIVECELCADGPMIRFEGIDSPEKAKAFNGYEILVPRTQASKLKKGEHYISDLIGLNVIDPDGQHLGIVKSWCEGAQAILLEVKRESAVYFLPFLRDVYVGQIDLKAGTLVLLEPRLAE